MDINRVLTMTDTDMLNQQDMLAVNANSGAQEMVEGLPLDYTQHHQNPFSVTQAFVPGSTFNLA